MRPFVYKHRIFLHYLPYMLYEKMYQLHVIRVKNWAYHVIFIAHILELHICGM